jgi:NADPH-dependent ferric siderophore reductase
MRRPVPDDLFGGRLAGCFLLDLEVAAVQDRTPTFRTITFRSEDLVDFEWQAGQDLMFEVPGDDSGVRRRYTIRRADPAAGTLDVDVVLHEHGRFAGWAKAVAPGARIEAIGPRGAVTVREGAGAHLFVGDESSIGATFAMVEALPAGAAATVVIACEGEPPVGPPVTPADLSLTWLPEADVVEHLAGVELAEGTVAYVNGERGLVRRAAAALADRGLPADAVTTKAYWRRDQPNAAHGEPAKD